MRSTKIIKICSSSLSTCLHHMVILRTRNKITDFLMILAWASPFNEMINAGDDSLLLEEEAVILAAGAIFYKRQQDQRREKMKRKRLWTRRWLLRCPLYGQYECLMKELTEEAELGYKNFQRIGLPLFSKTSWATLSTIYGE